MRSAKAPLYSRTRVLPPSRMDGATICGSLVADGCQIGEGAVIENSVIGLRCLIGRNVQIRNSVLMGNDFYEAPDEIAADLDCDRPPLGVGEGTRIEGAIIDKNARIGRNVQVVNSQGVETSEETPQGMICDGVFVMPKNTTLPDGWSV